MAKYGNRAAGSSSHVHLSLWTLDGKPAFFDPGAPHGMSELMRQLLAGPLAHAGEITYFLAPYVNSYKRFVAGTFAPTRAVWSTDNRTAGYRLVGAGTKSVRIECRVGGADLNPYLAYAALLAAGIAGIERELELEPEFRGDAYAGARVREIPKTLRAATETLRRSTMLRAALGEEVVDHYVHAARWEQAEFDRRSDRLGSRARLRARREGRRMTESPASRRSTAPSTPRARRRRSRASAQAGRARAAQKAWAARPLGRADRAGQGGRGAARPGERRPRHRARLADGPPGALRRRDGRRARAHRLHGRDRRARRWRRRSSRTATASAASRARAARGRPGHRAVELSVPDRDQHHRAGADRRQRGGAEACEPDAAGGRAAGAGLRAPAGGAVHQPLPRPRRHHAS